MKIPGINKLMSLCAGVAGLFAAQMTLHGNVIYQNDFAADTVGEQPSGAWTFSPGSNTSTNGAVIVDEHSDPAHPLGGRGLYIYNLSSSDPTHIRKDFNGGVAVSAVRAGIRFVPMYVAEDADTRFHFTLGRSGVNLNSAANRMFEVRMQNNGDFRVEYSRDGQGGDRGSTVVGSYDPTEEQEIVIFANSHGSDVYSYDDGSFAGSLQPNTMDIYLSGDFVGTFLLLDIPNAGSPPNPTFYESNADFSQFAFYQDSTRQGGVVINEFNITELDAPSSDTDPDLFSDFTDFEDQDVGGQPTGNWTFTPGTNTETNGALIIDSEHAGGNALGGNSLYIYDWAADQSTHIRRDIAAGLNLSAARVSFDFISSEIADEGEDDTRIHFSMGRSGVSLNSFANRMFEIRMQNNGGFRVEHSRDGTGGDRGASLAGTYDPALPQSVALFINTHSSLVANYDDGLLSGALQPNTMDVYLSGDFVGTYVLLDVPNPSNPPIPGFHEGDENLGQIAFYQDTSRDGGVIIDNLAINELQLENAGSEPRDLLVFIDNWNFEDDTPGERPSTPFPTTFSPATNTEGNGFYVINETTDPVNPIGPGKALYVYDYVGDGFSGSPSHMRFDFAPTNTDNIRVDLDFQRIFASDEEDEDTRIHIGVAPAGLETNTSRNRPFEIRVLNNGTLVVNYNPTGALEDGREAEVVADYDTEGSNSLTFFANGNNFDSLSYDDPVLGTGEVLPNHMVLFLNGGKVGEYQFVNTPDPTNAPHIRFFEESRIFGRFGLYQDSNRQGAVAFDNISIREFDQVPPPAAPTNLVGTALGPDSIELDWENNAANAIGFVIEQLEGDSWVEIDYVDIAHTTYVVEGLMPSTAYTFRVRSTHGELSEPSNEVTVATEEQTVPIVSEISEDALIPTGGSVTLSVQVLSPGEVAFQWYKGASGETENPVEGAIESSLTLSGMEISASYWVRITNDAGSVDSVAIFVEVFEPRTIRIVSIQQFHDLLPSALPGDTYVLDPGVYMNAGIRFEAEGTEDAPITLKAEIPGQVVLSGDSYLELGGEWLVVDGLVFTNGWNQSRQAAISFRVSSNRHAHHSRVTNCAIIDYSPADPQRRTDYVGMYGTHNRFDNNYLTGHSNIGVTLIVWRINGVEDHHLIDHNHFAFRADGGGQNGWETMRIGTSDDSLSSSKTVVEYNLFEECNGEIEIISNKSGENIYRYNTFLRSRGTLTLRHGDNCVVEGNVFLGHGISQTGAIRVIGAGHRILNNYIERTMGRDGAAITVYAGVPNSPLNEYFVADDTHIANNTIVDVNGPHIHVGAGFGSRDRTILPSNVVVSNNLFLDTRNTNSTILVGENAGDPMYVSNIASGISVGSGVTLGFTQTDVEMNRDERGILRPAIGSAVIGSAFGFPVERDMDGQLRSSPQDIGADQVSDVGGLHTDGPSRNETTGPLWMVASRFLPNAIPQGMFANAEIRANAVLFDNRLGEFYVGAFPWVYQQSLGWVAGFDDGEEGLLLLPVEGIGWLVVEPQLYPWVYNHSNASWLYNDRSGFRRFFDLSQNSWVHH